MHTPIKRILAGFCAAAVCCTLTSVSAETPNFNVQITVDVQGERTPISPYIYGVNEGYLDAATVTAVRQGGNRYTGYNWENNCTNAGSDWQHTSDNDIPANYDQHLANAPGARAIGLSQDAAANGVDYKITTIQLAGYVAADANGTVTETETAPSARWKEVRACKGDALSLTPDTTDDYVYMDEYVHYLVSKLGDATTATGIQGYNLDNEPGLWQETHPRLHPEQPTCAELVTKNIETAAAIKSIDPHAEVYGLTLYGMGTYLSLKDAPDWTSTYSAAYDWFLSYYLDQMAQAEETYGKRLIDVIDLHYYPDIRGENGECRATNCMDSSHTACIDARLQAVRTLYDETYVEDSWIGEWYSDFLPLFPKIQETINTYYPGTKHSVSEYNFGGADHISGAIAEADALGTFAAQGVYMAALWGFTGDKSYQLAGIDLYTNYDGNGAAFGSTLIPSVTSDPVHATSYASIEGEDTSEVHLILTNKSRTEAEHAAITLQAANNYRSAAVYGITEASSDIRLLQAVNDITDNHVSLELPPLSVVHIVISEDDFLLQGDANADGFVHTSDVKVLQDYLVQRSSAINAKACDLDGSGTLSGFDLALLKRQLTSDLPDPPVTFTQSEAGKWKLAAAEAAGKRVTCTFGGTGGCMATIVYGYWDSVLNSWVQDDTTNLGSVTFNSSGEVTVCFDVPAAATDLQVQSPYYAIYSGGTLTSLDISGVTLKSVTCKEIE